MGGANKKNLREGPHNNKKNPKVSNTLISWAKGVKCEEVATRALQAKCKHGRGHKLPPMDQVFCPSLPSEVKKHIVSLLDGDTLRTFSCVCWTFCALVEDDKDLKRARDMSLQSVDFFVAHMPPGVFLATKAPQQLPPEIATKDGIPWYELYMSGHCSPASGDVLKLVANRLNIPLDRLERSDLCTDWILDSYRHVITLSPEKVPHQITVFTGDSWRWYHTSKFHNIGTSCLNTIALIGWFENEQCLNETLEWIEERDQQKPDVLLLLVQLTSETQRREAPKSLPLIKLVEVARAHERVGVLRINADHYPSKWTEWILRLEIANRAIQELERGKEG